MLWSTAERELRAYIDALGSFSRNARLYLWVAFLGGFTVGVTRIIFNLYIQALGFDAAFLGQLLAVTTAAAGLTALPAGLLTDRWGTKRSLVWGSVGVGCGAFGQMVLTTPLLLLVSGALAGAGGAIALAAQAPFLAHHSSRRERTYLFSTMAALFSSAPSSAICSAGTSRNGCKTRGWRSRRCGPTGPRYWPPAPLQPSRCQYYCCCAKPINHPKSGAGD